MVKRSKTSKSKKIKTIGDKSKSIGIFGINGLFFGVGAAVISREILNRYSPENKNNAIAATIIGITTGTIFGIFCLHNYKTK